jgi:hypothetical protein
MLKYTTTGSPAGTSDVRPANHSHPSASRAFTYWKKPVSTGYSMYRTRSSGVPPASTNESR